MLLFLFSFNFLNATSWDAEYWQYFDWKNWEKGSYKLYTQAEVRLNRNSSRFCYLKISECFAYQALPCLTLEAHYSYLYHKGRGSPHFINTGRIELEVNPKWKLHDAVTIVWRNRFELIKNAHIPRWGTAFRHRVGIVLKPFDKERLVSIGCSNEVFYDFHTRKFTQNRFKPLEISFEIVEDKFFDFFLMVRNFFSSNRWYKSLVVGGELEF